MPTAVLPLPPQAPPGPPAARPVRISFVIDNLSRAGTETQLLALINTLDRRTFEPTLVLLDGCGSDSQELEPAGCEVIRLGVTKLLSRSAFRAAKRLRRVWADRRPDVVQAYFLDASYFAVPLARRAGVPTVIRVRNNLGYWLTARHRLLNRLIRRWVHVSLTNSDGGREALMRQDGLPPDRVVAIENGVDLDRFENARPPRLTGAVRVGCVANLRPVKNIDGLMRAARRVLDVHPEAVFEVAGEGDERPALERLRDKLDLGPRFVLRGQTDDVPAFLRSVDVAVLPSHSESMSNALLEYMAAGRVIVATGVGANAKLVRPGREGWVVKPGNDGALADGILAALRDPRLAARCADAARVRVEEEYSRDAMRTKFERLYLKLAVRL